MADEEARRAALKIQREQERLEREKK